MSRSATDLGFPTWVDAVAALFVWVLGAAVIYGIAVFVTLEGNPLTWSGAVRLMFVGVQLFYAGMVFDAATDDDGDEE